VKLWAGFNGKTGKLAGLISCSMSHALETRVCARL